MIAHSSKTVKHRSRVATDPTQPNLRQVHLVHSELFNELAEKDFLVVPGAMGENITTHGIDLLNLPKKSISNQLKSHHDNRTETRIGHHYGRGRE